MCDSHSEIPLITIFVVIIISLWGGVISYLMKGKKRRQTLKTLPFQLCISSFTGMFGAAWAIECEKKLY